MAVMKCEMCGGELEIKPGEEFAVCKYCGSKHMLPYIDDEEDDELEEDSSPMEEEFWNRSHSKKTRKKRENWMQQMERLGKDPKEIIYEKAWRLLYANATQTVADVEEAKALFEQITDWEDAADQVIACKYKIRTLKTKEQFREEEIRKQQKKQEIYVAAVKNKPKKGNKWVKRLTPIVVGVLLMGLVFHISMERSERYEQAVAFFEAGAYEHAKVLLNGLGNYKDSASMRNEIWYIQQYEQANLC